MTYEQGQIDYIAWMTSPTYAQFNHDASPRTVMKLFLPPVPEDAMQVSRPLPKPYQEWLRGFNDARKVYEFT